MPQTKPQRELRTSARQPQPDTICSKYIVGFQDIMRLSAKADATRMQGITKPSLHMEWEGTSAAQQWSPPTPQAPSPIPPPRNVVCGGGKTRSVRCAAMERPGSYMMANSLPLRPTRHVIRETGLSHERQRAWMDDALQWEMRKTLLGEPVRRQWPSLQLARPKAQKARPNTCTAANQGSPVSSSGIACDTGGKPQLPWERAEAQRLKWKPAPPPSQTSTLRPLTADEALLQRMTLSAKEGRRNINLPPSLSISLATRAQLKRRLAASTEIPQPAPETVADEISQLTDEEILGSVLDPIIKNDLKQKKKLWRELYDITSTALKETKEKRAAIEKSICAERQHLTHLDHE